MEPNIEREITGKKTPFHGHPALPKMDKDFLEMVASKRFKDSVDKVRRYLGDTGVIQGRNPVGNVLRMTTGGLQRIAMIEHQNKPYLEELAVELIVKERGLVDREKGESLEYSNGFYKIIRPKVKGKKPKTDDDKIIKLQFKVELVHGFIQSDEGMRQKPEPPSKEEIEQSFSEFADAFEKFDLERAKRKFLNSLVQGAAFKGGGMYVLVSDELEKIDPELLQLYGVTQSLMEHLYWILPNMEGLARSGGGQLGQSKVDRQSYPITITAKASTFPLLVHELEKGLRELFSLHGLPQDPKQQKLVMQMEDTLPGEIWDSRFGPVFWEKLQESYPVEIFEEDQRHIQNYLFAKFSKLDAEEFFKVVKWINSGDPQGAKFMKKLVDDIVSELKRMEAEDVLGSDDDNYDDDVDLEDLK